MICPVLFLELFVFGPLLGGNPSAIQFADGLSAWYDSLMKLEEAGELLFPMAGRSATRLSCGAG